MSDISEQAVSWSPYIVHVGKKEDIFSMSLLH